MYGIQIGYARVSTADQDLTSQRDALLRLGVLDSNMYVDHGLTGTNRARPGLREALAAVREGDTLVVTKLDRLACSVRDARDIADELTMKGVALSLGGSRYDPTDPVGRLLFNVLAMVAEFERDLISMRTKEGMAVARAKGHLKGTAWANEAEAGYDVDALKRRGCGRPGRGAEPAQVVTLRLTADELAAIDARAAREHKSRSELIREAIALYMA